MPASLLVAAALCSAAHAMAYGSMPVATRVVGDVVEGPKPTEGPPMIELLKRQAMSTTLYTALLGPDNTCGYFGGRPGAPFYCGAAYTCNMLLPLTPGVWGNLACCNSVVCGVRNACVDLAQYSTSSLCDNNCAKDSFTLKCTASSAPYCNSLRFLQQSVQDYFCDDTSVNSYQTLTTTYSNEVDGRVWRTTTFSLDPVSSVSTLTSNGAISVTTRTTAGNSILSGSVTATGAAAGGSDSPSGGGGSRTPIGAIVGGVIGGIALLAIIATIIFFCLRSKKRNAAAGGNYQGPIPQQPGPPNYGPASGVDNSAYMATQAKPPMSQQNGYYPPPMQQENGQVGQQYPQNQGWNGNNQYAPVPQQQQHGYGAAAAGAALGAGVVGAGMASQEDPNKQRHLSEVEGSTVGTLNNLSSVSHPTSPMSETGRGQSIMASDVGSPTLSNTGVNGIGSGAGVQSGDGQIHEMSATSGPISSHLHESAYELGGDR